MGLTDRFYWPKFYEAMVNYKLGNIWIKAVPAYLVAFLVFVVGNMGTRMVKVPLIIKWLKDFKKIKMIEIFLLAVILGRFSFSTTPLFFQEF